MTGLDTRATGSMTLNNASDHYAEDTHPHPYPCGPSVQGRFIGWHYLSNAACLIRPHLFSTALLV